VTHVPRSAPRIFLRVTLPLSGMNFLNQASRALIATIAPLLALEFALSATELGLLAALFFVSYAAAQLPVGLAMDLFGVRRVQMVLALVSALGFALCAVSSSLWLLAVGRLVTGIGISVGMVAMLTANSQWFPRHRVAAMTGIGIFIAAFGGMAATVPVQWAIPQIGWRGVFWILAGLAVLVAGAIALAVPERPAQQPAAPPRRTTLAQEVGTLLRVFAHPVFLRFVPSIALLSALNFTYGGLWAGPWLRDVGGFADAPRATLLLAYMAGMMAGSMCTSQLASHLSQRGHDPLTVPWIAMGGIWLVQVLLILHPFQDAWLIGGCWFLFSFLSSAAVSGYAAIGQRFPPDIAGRVNTAINFSMLVLVVILQNAIGWILDLWPRTSTGGWDGQGYGWAMAMTLVLQVLTTAGMLRGGRRR